MKVFKQWIESLETKHARISLWGSMLLLWHLWRYFIWYRFDKDSAVMCHWSTSTWKTYTYFTVRSSAHQFCEIPTSPKLKDFWLPHGVPVCHLQSAAPSANTWALEIRSKCVWEPESQDASDASRSRGATKWPPPEQNPLDESHHVACWKCEAWLLLS